MVDAHEYMTNNSLDRDDFADLEPSECLFIHHRTTASFMASIRDGCAMCNYTYRQSHIDIPSSLQEHEEDPNSYFSVFSIEINSEYNFFSIQVLAKTARSTGFVIEVVGKTSNYNDGF